MWLNQVIGGPQSVNVYTFLLFIVYGGGWGVAERNSSFERGNNASSFLPLYEKVFKKKTTFFEQFKLSLVRFGEDFLLFFGMNFC